MLLALLPMEPCGRIWGIEWLRVEDRMEIFNTQMSGIGRGKREERG